MTHDEQREAQVKAALPVSSPMGTVQMLTAALSYHQSGHFTEAAALYRRILAVDSRNAHALHLLGVIALQERRYGAAAGLIGKAIALKKTVPVYYSNYGNALRALGRPEEALAAYEAALRIKPDDAEIHASRGVVLKALGRFEEAIAAYDAALRIKPDDAETHSNRGNALQELGRFEEALAAYDTALRIKPELAALHYNRGNALQALGRLEESLVSYDAALRIKPDYAQAHSNRGVVLKALGRFEEAVTAYDAALRINPDLAEAHSNRGNALEGLGRFEEAVAAYDTALRINPDVTEAHFNRGNALVVLGRVEEALAAYEAVLRIKPDLAEAHSNRGNALKELGRFEEALAAYDTALRIRPDYAQARSNRGVTLKALGHFEEALAAYDAALRIKPDDAQAHYNRGNALEELGRFEEALASYDAALRIKPDYAEAQSNRGNALQDLGRFEEALAAYEAALRIDPDYAEAQSNRGFALQALGRLEEALAAYDTALRIDPDLAEAHANRCLALLLAGNFAEGWRGYEWRWLKKELPHDMRRHETFPRWQGEPADGRTLLAWSEQGLGDTIQFARYLPLLRQRGWRVIFEVPSLLARLLDGLADVTVVAQGDPLPPFDLQCPLLSLPLGFGTTLETIPAAVPYVTAEPERRAFWRQRLPKDGFRIGIVWQGSPIHSNDRHRSIPLKQFAPLSAIPGVRLVGLQKNHGLDQLAGLPEGMTVQTLGAEYDEGGFPDTAALIMELDLIVSADTSVAHLAGALGRPVWVALPMAPDWRWLLNRADSPWYPSMRLFRQPERDDWDSVFHEIARAARTVRDAAPR